MKNAIESFKELADYGEETGVRVTIENHWGLAAGLVNILLILNEVNSLYLESSPDSCNREHEYMLYHGLEMLVPGVTSKVHAKWWICLFFQQSRRKFFLTMLHLHTLNC